MRIYPANSLHEEVKRRFKLTRLSEAYSRQTLHTRDAIVAILQAVAQIFSRAHECVDFTVSRAALLCQVCMTKC